jgi:hypothetical protein
MADGQRRTEGLLQQHGKAMRQHYRTAPTYCQRRRIFADKAPHVGPPQARCGLERQARPAGTGVANEEGTESSELLMAPGLNLNAGINGVFFSDDACTS